MSGGRWNAELGRYVASHLLAVVAEWAAFIALLVYVNDRHGSTVMGIAAIAMLLPSVIAAPFAGRFAERLRPNRVRLAGLAGQVFGYGVAALTAYQDAPTWTTIGGAIVALAAATTMRPAGAVMLPAIVHSSRQLTTANLWVGHAESASVLVGPLVTTGLLAVGGARFALAGCAVIAAGALTVAGFGAQIDPPASDASTTEATTTAVRHVIGVLRSIVARPGGAGVLAVSIGQFVLVGALDLILVVTAIDALGMGDTGVGILNTALGAGALASMAVASIVVRRRRLAPFLIAAVVAIIATCIALGAHVALLTALIALPILGVGASLLDLLSRMLLQRSAPPNELGAVFSLLEVGSGLGLLAGTVLAQALLVSSGPRAAWFGVASVFFVLLVVGGRALRLADDGADVPVVEMSLLRLDPVFAPLPAIELESIARTASELEVRAGEIVIRQGEPGDTYYVVVNGAFDVSVDEAHVRTARRGGSFGEVALLADVARTGTVTALEAGSLLAIDRVPFLVAVTGHDSSEQAAWGVIRSMGLGFDVGEHPGPRPGTSDPATANPAASDDR